MTLSGDAHLQARTLIARRLGLDLPEERLDDVERALSGALRRSGHPTPLSYLAWLATAPDEAAELRHLAADLTIGETYFFRDRSTFEALEQRVLPRLIASRRSEGVQRLRLWSAACATGEEAYSLAILLDRLLPDGADWSVTILATDINPRALETAARGLYRDWSLRETPADTRERYFQRRDDRTYELDPAVRRAVTFAPLNLAQDAYPSVVTNTAAMDVVLCRNVLMYFTEEAQRAAVGRLRRALVPGGWLVVSPAEASVDLLSPLVPVNYPGAILYRKDPASAPSHPSWTPEALSADPPAPLPRWSEPTPPGPSEPEPLLARSPASREEVPPEPPRDLERARVLADQGDLDEARRLCEAALARDRLDPEPQLLLAAICQERGELQAAHEALRRTLYLAPNSASAHFLLGSLLLREGERSRGRRCIETVIALLGPVPTEELVAGGGGLTAGRLLETARAYLEAEG